VLTFSYARFEITLMVLLGAAGSALTGYYFGWWALAPAVLALALLAFYRNPPRHAPPGDNIVLAPADGKIVEISRGAADPDGAEPVLRIMIFLSVFDVHVNRSPCAGKVTQVTYRRGEFLNALRSDADARNECNTLSIDPRPPLPGPIRVRQIAGVLARRIVCAVKPGYELDIGERFGMIKLGSRTELRLPENPGWTVTVAVGEHVRAGVTVLARLRREAMSSTSAQSPDYLAARVEP
jgi:phosphatidylserine decarboxylase